MEREVVLPNYLVHGMPYGMWVTTGGPIPYECAYSHRVDRCVDNSMPMQSMVGPQRVEIHVGYNSGTQNAHGTAVLSQAVQETITLREAERSQP